MRSINVPIVLAAMALASHAVPVQDHCHLPPHLRPLSCDAQNGKRQAGLRRAFHGLGIGIKLPETRNTQPFHTTNHAPPKTDRPPASSITKATPTKMISPSPTTQYSKTNVPSSAKEDAPSDTLTSAKPSGTADVPRTSWRPRLDAAGHIVGYVLEGTNTFMTILDYNARYGGGGSDDSSNAEPSGTLSVDRNTTIDPVDGAGATAGEGDSSATAEGTGIPDAAP